LEGFHIVLGANLIDRLVNPQHFLKEIGKRIVPGGFLVLCSPYTWMADYTPKENWVGGKQVGGENLFTR
jgi:2-polyprenyl-3-methyl-5-hydroxy-6-metoxy-1,4-benzoquinol methylase